MSIAGGLYKAIERGESIGCTCIQIFTKSNRQWHAKKISDSEAQAFIDEVHNSSIKPEHIAVHASYLINIATENNKAVAALIEELKRCQQLHIPYLVLHPGTRSPHDTQETALIKIAHNLDSVFAAVPGNTYVVLETMAGQGNSMCSSLPELAYVRNNSKNPNRIGFCIDTCHIFAAGYNITTTQGYTAFWKEVDESIGIAHVKVMHLNDSKKGLGCRVDRHEDIGHGQLGIEPFRLISNDSRLKNIIKVLETPQTTDNLMADYQRNMNIIKKLVK